MNLTTARRNFRLAGSKNTFPNRGAVVMGVFVMALASACQASTMIYGNFPGADVMFTNVLEESETDPLPLFGAPLSTSNSLSFTPVSFSSSSSNNNADITDSQLSLTMAVMGDMKEIKSIIIDEAGDFTLSGTGDANASVGAAVFWTVLEVDGVALPGPLPTGTANVPFDQGLGANGGSFSLPADLGVASIWTGRLVIDIKSFLAAQDVVNNMGRVTKLGLTLNNTLATSSSVGSSSFIKKKESQQVAITVETLPEPASILMLLVSLLGLTLLRRRGK